MFSTEEFIEASRKFVCVRIETFENKESEQLVKKVLNGRLANTAFVIFNPSGTKTLTRSGRGPQMAMAGSRTDTSGKQNTSILASMNRIAKQFKSKSSSAELQDFHSLRQALNCASADQRLLVVVNGAKSELATTKKTLKSVFADEEVIGKYHLNFLDPKTDRNWTKVLNGEKKEPGIMVVRSSQFGLEGQVIEQLKLDAGKETIVAALSKANTQFAKQEVRKNYEQHVQAGRRKGIEFENEISREGAADYRGNRSPTRGKRR